MSEENNEKVVLETKLTGGENNTNKEEKTQFRISVNEEQAAANIAKSLIQDFMQMINMAIAKSVIGTYPEKDKFVSGMKDMWKNRCSVLLAEETKMFQDSIYKAMNSETNIDEETQKKMKETVDSFNKTRDIAVDMADKAVESIISIINPKSEPSK